MGPDMPPSKKAQSPSSAATGASRGSLSPPYRGGGEGAAGAEDRADLSLSLSASFSAAKAEDEELTSLSWLHESTDLLNSFSHSGLRSVSPLQGDGGGGGAGGGVPPPGAAPRSPSSSSPSPDPCGGGGDGSPYDLATGANRKPPYSFSCLIFMAIEDAPSKRLPVKDIYGWILEHFPYFAGAPTGWKNSVRHNLSLNKCFKKVDKDRSQSIGKGSLWSIDPEYRHNLIQALKKTPYHPYSPGLVTPSASPPNSPQTYHSPPLWPGNPFFRKNGGVLLQVPGGVIQNGAHVRSQGLFPVIRPLPVTPVGSRTSAIRSALGDYLSRGHPAPAAGDSAPTGDDQGEEDHTYSTGKSPSMPCSSQGLSDDDGSDDDDDDIIAVEVRGIKSEPREIPVDSAFLSQQPRRALRGGAAAALPWTKNRLRALGDTLPLKKRRAAAEKEESDDEEMKEAAGSLLHLAGVRACLNNITNRTAKGQKEPKEALRD